MTYWQKEESRVSSVASTWHNPKTQTTKAVDTAWKQQQTLFFSHSINLIKSAQQH